MYRIEMLPAGRGDSILIEYGPAKAVNRILIDGGIGATAVQLRTRLEALRQQDRRLELLIVTHMDLDHIAGVLGLLRDLPEGLVIDDVWFNGWKHLPEQSGLLGVKQAESLTELLERQMPGRWNRAFGGDAVMIPETGELPEIALPGGMRMTVLSPTPDRLARLRTVWQKAALAEADPDQPGHPDEQQDGGWLLDGDHPDIGALAGKPFKSDTSVANGSSIALLATYAGKRCLFAGDAFAADVRNSVEKMAEAEGADRLAVDAFKLAHHGGKKSTSPGLLSSVACSEFLFSTDGSVYGHPDRETVARVLVHGRGKGTPRLHFNYASEENRLWRREDLQRKNQYECRYPEHARGGIVIEL